MLRARRLWRRHLRDGCICFNTAASGSVQQKELFAGLLKSCKDLAKGKQIHGQILQSKLDADTFLGNLVLQMYGRCGKPEEARKAFDRMHSRNAFSWSIMMTVYIRTGHLEEAKSMFDKMPERDVVSWTSMLAAFSQDDEVLPAKAVFDTMPQRNVVSWNAMGTVYAQNGHLLESEAIFLKSPMRSVVSWNSMITAYGEVQNSRKVKSLFEEMPERDVVSWNVTITALAGSGQLDEAMKMLDLMPETSMICWTAMVVAHGERGLVREAKRMFDTMPERDVLAGTAMLVAFSQNRNLVAAKATFDEMPRHNIFAWNAMLAAYAQNGHIDDAMKIFNSMPEKDVVSWNGVLAVHSQNGDYTDAIELFRSMHLHGFKPNEVSYLSILIACSRMGMVEKGREYFVSLVSDHGMRPAKVHYCCMIDTLGRAGQLAAAEELIKNMPFVPDYVAWVSLVGACRVYRDVIRGAEASQNLMRLKPEGSGAYVVAANVYAAAERQEEMALVRKMMKETVVKQNPGMSTIEIDNVVHSFTVGDASHPANMQIRAELQRLTKLMEEEGYAPETQEVLHLVGEDEKEGLLGDHSEKLAIAFGLISTPAGSPLRVLKNLRVCLDCHSATKLISKIVGRKIVVRDSSRYHVFEHGSCSCADFW